MTDAAKMIESTQGDINIVMSNEPAVIGGADHHG